MYKDPDGKRKDAYIICLLIDGVTVGHSCCAIFNCHIPLSNNRHQFCPTHRPVQENLRSVIGCDNPIVKGRRTCSIKEHQDVEDVYDLHGQSRFQLQERLDHTCVSHPDDALANDVDSSELIDPTNAEEEFELDDQVTAVTKKKKRVRAQFGCHRTFCQELLVAPYGLISYRTTYYGAEGVASVAALIRHTYVHDEDLKPAHIFYNNNCHLAKHVKGDAYFQDIGLSVDVFHFHCKHSEKDTFCQENCNPAVFPELKGEGGKGWFFNLSITEQTNAWFGGYHSICWEMLVDKFNFFLGEMIIRCNRGTLQKLAEGGQTPCYWPCM
ncbi:hypothetical protein BDR03DRAFT_981530 [Suillus americanus]|nr:hypothetical protein BDR03DRAFT_981530 [Suillus americanus]